jgi:hypothetical protein
MLMAATDTGEVLVWDLSQIRPQTFVFENTEVEVALTSDSVWTQNSPGGFYRRPFASNKPELVAKIHTPMSMFAPSTDERAIAALDIEGTRFIAGEIDKPGMMDVGVTTFGVMEHGFVYGKATGELKLWQPSGVEQIAKLPGKIDLAVAAAEHFLVTVDDHELVRIDARTRAQEHLTVDMVVWRIALANTGTVWFLAGERAFRWDPGAKTAEEVSVPEPPDGMTLARNGAVIHTPRSLIVCEGNGTRVISHSSSHFTNIDEDLLMTSDSLGKVSVVDVTSGAIFDLPLMSSVALRAPLATEKGLIGYEHGSTRTGARLFGVNRLTVPRDPAKLREWLAKITNAKPIPGSEAVAWP